MALSLGRASLVIAAATLLLPAQEPSATKRDVPAIAMPDMPNAKWGDSVRFGLQIEGGVTLNARQDAGSLVFGATTTDRANLPTLNQVQLTVERPIQPNEKHYDFGFAVQLVYGSDGRFLHIPGQFDRLTGARD